jgi:capsular polysaccharide export protein
MRRFLLLQGPVGPFFAQLAAALAAAGQGVHRIRFNGGDLVNAWGGPASDFHGTAEDWPNFLEHCLRREASTDLLLFGDCRPLHRAAIAHCAARGLRIHVFEEGYLRPGWITLEAGGVNGHSSLPDAPKDYLDAGAQLPEPRRSIAPLTSFGRRATEDVLYTLATAALWPVYRGYRTHKPWSPLAEYRAGARRFFRQSRFRAEAAQAAEALIAKRQAFFLFPLQLDSDAQIRVHSEFGRMQPALETVIRSFAAHAPADVRLVLSEHPLDQAVVDLQPQALACARECGIADRVLYLRGGTPPALVPSCLGMVTVNSTMGLTALEAGRPLAVLGSAIYRLPGLAHDGPLDTFWAAPTAPQAPLFAAFRRVLVARTQLPGGYYCPAARRWALEGALARLLAPTGRHWPGPRSERADRTLSTS